MLNHTTSYPPKRPQRRRGNKTTGYQLPRGRARARHRPGSSYVHHSQGFGSDTRRRAMRVRRGGGSGGRGSKRRNARWPYVLVIVGCAGLVFLASLIGYLNRSVTIELNGSDASVHIGATIAQVIEDEGFEESCNPGNLLAVDDSIITRGGGERYTVTLDGKDVDADDYDSVKLEGGEKLEIHDGGDVYEEHDVQATEIAPTITVKGSGAIGYVSQWGVPGRSEVWTGKLSGITADRGVVQEVQNCEVTYRSASPDDEDTRYIALTFDEGPSEYTQQILDILEEKGVSATFFLQGDAVEADPASAKAIAEAGHEIGSNGYSDTNYSDLTSDEVRSQITRGFDAIEDATGERVSLLRAPYASFSTENWAQCMDLLSGVVSWNVDSGDWLLPGADAVVENVVGSAGNGNIVLLTDNDTTGAQLVEALPDIIDQLKAEGYTFVTLSDLIATDEDFADVDLASVSMPKDAVLPNLPADDDAEGEE